MKNDDPCFEPKEQEPPKAENVRLTPEPESTVKESPEYKSIIPLPLIGAVTVVVLVVIMRQA